MAPHGAYLRQWPNVARFVGFTFVSAMSHSLENAFKVRFGLVADPQKIPSGIEQLRPQAYT